MSFPFELIKYQKTGENSIGQPIMEWQKTDDFHGYMDLMTGSDVNQTNSLIAESTQIVMTWDTHIKFDAKDRILNPRTQQTFEITFADIPMELNSHWEIYVKRVI